VVCNQVEPSHGIASSACLNCSQEFSGALIYSKINNLRFRRKPPGRRRESEPERFPAQPLRQITTLLPAPETQRKTPEPAYRGRTGFAAIGLDPDLAWNFLKRPQTTSLLDRDRLMSEIFQRVHERIFSVWASLRSRLGRTGRVAPALILSKLTLLRFRHLHKIFRFPIWKLPPLFSW
jgi:hypothetical protein